MSNTDDDGNEEHDCPLCLLPLNPYDHSHPLQCPSRHCHFNCCMDCLEHMIKSTKDEHSEASDGNVFRVFLHCPNCRSNLGPSIRDTVLLRKVDKYSSGMEVVDETRLPASELRFKYALERDEDVAAAIEGARHREDEFFGKGIEVDAKSSEDFISLGGSSRGSTIWSFDDEEGFETELDKLDTSHKSFIFHHHSTQNLGVEVDETKQLEDIQPDPTLLCGLDAFMTDEEKQFMTMELISGDTAKLAAATEMMHYVSALSRQGIKPNLKRKSSSVHRKASRNRSMLASVKEVIREGNEARRLEEEKGARRGVGVVASQLNNAAVKTVQFVGVAGGRRNQKNLVDLEIKRQMDYMKLHPLPLRMPKYAEVSARKAESMGLTFLDDTWDGTVLDAFSKIYVNKSLLGHVIITKHHAESIGIRRVIDAGGPKSCKTGKGYIDTVRPRVIVASINKELGQQGIVKGDVVTHFNGEVFTGTASELTELINNRFEGEVLTFVFNADSAVAEALKRRSLIADH